MVSTRAGFELCSVTKPGDSEAYRFEYDQETTPASMAVVAALSEAMDVDPTELEPLYESVDTNALDALVGQRSTSAGDIHATFTHEGWELNVYSDGAIAVTPGQHERTNGQRPRIRPE